MALNGIPITTYNSYDSYLVDTDGMLLIRTIGYPGDVITNYTSGSVIRPYIAPFLNVNGDTDQYSDDIFSQSVTLLDFYNKFKNRTLSEYTPLFNQLSVDYSCDKYMRIYTNGS